MPNRGTYTKGVRNYSYFYKMIFNLKSWALNEAGREYFQANILRSGLDTACNAEGSELTGKVGPLILLFLSSRYK